MKLKHLKKTVSVLLSAALIATLVGCSSSSMMEVIQHKVKKIQKGLI